MRYYDTEKKWRARRLPKRDIILEKCFNIIRKIDSRDSINKPVIGVYTMEDCVGILLEVNMRQTLIVRV